MDDGCDDYYNFHNGRAELRLDNGGTIQFFNPALKKNRLGLWMPPRDGYANEVQVDTKSIARIGRQLLDLRFSCAQRGMLDTVRMPEKCCWLQTLFF